MGAYTLFADCFVRDCSNLSSVRRYLHPSSQTAQVERPTMEIKLFYLFPVRNLCHSVRFVKSLI